MGFEPGFPELGDQRLRPPRHQTPKLFLPVSCTVVSGHFAEFMRYFMLILFIHL